MLIVPRVVSPILHLYNLWIYVNVKAVLPFELEFVVFEDYNCKG